MVHLDRASGAPILPVMRLIILTAAVLSLSVLSARADSCGDLIDSVVAETKATLVNRTIDFAEMSSIDGMTLTLACGDPSAVGVQFKGETPGDAYYGLFGRAGRIATGIGADLIEAAARRAREQAVVTRHSHADAATALVTCSVTNGSRGPMTGCAVVDKRDR
ncbi:hypothetical protein OICFNHDK_2421 [Methylobacterium bullatum]|uniref:ABC transporter ATPase n=2 Tax=Methylobacterium bullatum TaxID=570505 RepID=A0AAV4Z814_9HYPH|nr:hypothetical protein [Methylobacterium bullatum]GJD39957.1 hypothetical protein OICFNHDK_2421 [Methylobacterium bullatum]